MINYQQYRVERASRWNTASWSDEKYDYMRSFKVVSIFVALSLPTLITLTA